MKKLTESDMESLKVFIKKSKKAIIEHHVGNEVDVESLEHDSIDFDDISVYEIISRSVIRSYGKRIEELPESERNILLAAGVGDVVRALGILDDAEIIQAGAITPHGDLLGRIHITLEFPMRKTLAVNDELYERSIRNYITNSLMVVVMSVCMRERLIDARVSLSENIPLPEIPNIH